MKKVWKYWVKAIGPKEFDNDRQADVVAVIRTLWVILHLLTCLAIITNALASHGIKGLLGL